ncbi:hypothetical protein VNI00_010775 [Paramarasmius palmivorus]|uniref:Fork-head domain-containing protein n=1 Tax=Paramarasmius palmivorus TaxID=297713 RepID=A0AAW0CF94_9AGAR
MNAIFANATPFYLGQSCPEITVTDGVYCGRLDTLVTHADVHASGIHSLSQPYPTIRQVYPENMDPRPQNSDYISTEHNHAQVTSWTNPNRGSYQSLQEDTGVHSDLHPESRLLLPPYRLPNGIDIDEAERLLRQANRLSPQIEVKLSALPEPILGEKHPYSYSTLIQLGIWESPARRLTLQGIYDAILKKFPGYASMGQSWRNSIRHTLSLKKAFVNQGRGRSDVRCGGGYWELDILNLTGNKRDRKRCRKKQSEGFANNTVEPSMVPFEQMPASNPAWILRGNPDIAGCTETLDDATAVRTLQPCFENFDIPQQYKAPDVTPVPDLSSSPMDFPTWSYIPPSVIYTVSSGHLEQSWQPNSSSSNPIPIMNSNMTGYHPSGLP